MTWWLFLTLNSPSLHPTASAEVDAFRGFFAHAVACEKERILDQRRARSAAAASGAALRMCERTLAREDALRRHFEAMTEAFKDEVSAMRREEREEDGLQKRREREQKLRIAREREAAMAHLAPGAGAFNTVTLGPGEASLMKRGITRYMQTTQQQ